MFGAPLTVETFYNEQDSTALEQLGQAADEYCSTKNGGDAGLSSEGSEINGVATAPTAEEEDTGDTGEDTGDAGTGIIEGAGAGDAGDGDAFQNKEGFNNQVTFGRNFLTLDATLRALLFACLFFVLTHSDTQGLLNKLAKMLPKLLKPYVPMLVFAVLYYVVNMFI